MSSFSSFHKNLFRALTYGVIIGTFGEHFRQKYTCLEVEVKHQNWLLEPIKDMFSTKSKPQKAVSNLYSTGEVFFKHKQCSESLAYFKKAVEIMEVESVKDNLLLCKCYLFIARIYQEQNKSVEAVEKSRKALDILLKNNVEDKELLAEAYHYHGISHKLQDEYYQAKKNLQMALELKKAHAGKDPISIADTYHELYKLYAKYENYVEAFEYLNAAMEIYAGVKQVRPGLNILYMSDLLNSINMIGGIKDKQFDDLFLNAKQFVMENPKLDKDISSSFFYNYGKYIISKGAQNEGFDYLKKSLIILKDSHGKTHPKVQALYRELYSTYMSYFRDPGELIYLMKL